MEGRCDITIRNRDSQGSTTTLPWEFLVPTPDPGDKKNIDSRLNHAAYESFSKKVEFVTTFTMSNLAMHFSYYRRTAVKRCSFQIRCKKNDFGACGSPNKCDKMGSEQIKKKRSGWHHYAIRYYHWHVFYRKIIHYA